MWIRKGLRDRKKGVEFVGVDIRDDVPSAQKYDAHYGVTYPSLDDPSNRVALAFRGSPPNATPTTIVLDRAGRVAARQSGTILYTQLRDLVDRIVQMVTDAGRELTAAEFGAFFYNVYRPDGGAYMLHTLSGAERSQFEGMFAKTD